MISRVAFIGLGVMGYPMAGHLARAGLEVTVYNRTGAKAEAWVKEYGGRHAATPALAAEGADAVFLCVGNDQDLHQVTLGEDGAVSTLATGAVLVDLSRGGVVVQSALLDALDRGALAGAALDVFETEPLPLDSPLWSRADILVTPHCSSVFDGWEEASFRIFADNLGRYRRGEPLVNVVDPQRGY